MRIFITGSNGLLGQKLLMTLSGEIHELHGCDLADSGVLRHVRCGYEKLDLTDRNRTVTKIRDLAPEIIIHAAAMTNVDRCEIEKEACWAANVSATEHIVLGAEKVGAKVIFISTDYVFDGLRGPYSENDRPNPLQYYGRSKLAAENLIRGSNLDWAIIRTIVLYGFGLGVQASFLKWLVDELSQGRPVRIVNDQFGNNAFADDLADGIDQLITCGFNGIINIAGKENLNRYEFSCRVAQYFGFDDSLITPVKTSDWNPPAARPLKSGLKIDLAQKKLNYNPRSLEEALAIYKAQAESARG